MAKLKINGAHVDIKVEGNTPLLWALREQLGLTGSKYGCGIGQCGACMVLIKGEAVPSCMVTVDSLNADDDIVTIEGLSKDGTHPLQQAFKMLDTPQCGYCIPGIIMSAAALLESNPRPSDDEIDAGITNICRSGTYARVRKGIHLAAKMTEEDKA